MSLGSPWHVMCFWLGVLLLPALWEMAQSVAATFAGLEFPTGSALAFTVGALGYGAVHLGGRPAEGLYVWVHELTHALLVVLCGGRVTSFKVTPKGGATGATHDNLLITLGPYFFPLLPITLAACFWVAHASGWDPPTWGRWLESAAVGAALSHHVLFTGKYLATRQPDFEKQGWLFSTVLVLIGNGAVLIAAVGMLYGFSPWGPLSRWLGHSGQAYADLWSLIYRSAGLG